MAEYSFDQRGSLEHLVARAGHLKYETQKAVDARRTTVSRKMEEADNAVTACKKQLKEYASSSPVYFSLCGSDTQISLHAQVQTAHVVSARSMQTHRYPLLARSDEPGRSQGERGRVTVIHPGHLPRLSAGSSR